jgi:hypothetical protein
LHTVGGIIGAAVAPALGGGRERRSYLPLTHYWDEEDYEPVPLTQRGRPGRAPSLPSAVKLFWWTLLLLMGVVPLLVLGWTSRGSGFTHQLPSAIYIGVIIILFVLPGLQLGAALVTALILAVSPRPDKGYQFRQLGKIVLGVVVGTLLGVLVMVGVFVVLTHR